MKVYPIRNQERLSDRVKNKKLIKTNYMHKI